MRKKSHILLARYIVEDMKVPVMTTHRKAFYLGSIVPDCKPSFITQKHEFFGTFEMVKDQIQALALDSNLILENARSFMCRLGEIIHYVADYFTFPHNITYEGGFRDHCAYEKDLKRKLVEYVSSGKAFRGRIDCRRFETPEAICNFVREAHDEYLKMQHVVEEDCEYIVRICHQVVQAILNLVNKAIGAEMTKRLCFA